jgi:hypothetical protein
VLTVFADSASGIEDAQEEARFKLTAVRELISLENHNQ